MASNISSAAKNRDDKLLKAEKDNAEKIRVANDNYAKK